jgi:hypothetical protein
LLYLETREGVKQQHAVTSTQIEYPNHPSGRGSAHHDIVYMQLVGYWLLGGLVAVDRLFESFSLYL